MNKFQYQEYAKVTLKYPPENYVNLTNLSLDLSNNSIGDTEAESFLSPLSKFLNLVSLSLDLS